MNGMAKYSTDDKGYSRTTARDIASAAGTSLAAIGYHFGSTDRLLSEAMLYGVERWSRTLAPPSEDGPTKGTPLARIRATWSGLLGAFDEQRPLWSATFEAYGQIENHPDLRAFITQAQHDGRSDFARQLLGIDPEADPQGARAVGSVFYAIWVGVLAQYLIDRQGAPSADELADGLRRIADALTSAGDARPSRVATTGIRPSR